MEFTADIASKQADDPPAIRLCGKSPKVSGLELLVTAHGVVLSGTTDALGCDDIKQLCVVLRSAVQIHVGFRAGVRQLIDGPPDQAADGNKPQNGGD